MNQLCMTFIETRARTTDCDTSKDAAKHAVSHKASTERMLIRMAVLSASKGLTAREVAAQAVLDYIEVQRRISECGLIKTKQRRDGCAVWVAA